jgi:hypothetical protein
VRLCDLVCCPLCAAPLGETLATLRCHGCARDFPRVGGIPVLVPEPEPLVTHFQKLAGAFERDMGLGLDELLAQTATYELAPRTRARLEALHEHLIHHRTRLLALFRGAGLDVARKPAATGGDRTLQVPGIMEHYAQIHRDWGWDESEAAEAREATELVSSFVGERALGKLLVLGAGACRLTQDLHHRHGAEGTLALDINPLPFLVAARLLRGERVPLYEFSPWPQHSERLFADRVLASSLAPTENLHLIFADGLAPPVRPLSFDSVLTPWFVDQVPLDLRELARRIFALMPVGGRWLNFGPLLYEQNLIELPYRYCVDEVLELIENEGFVVERHSVQRMSYLCSPISSQGRVETVLTFSAEKRRESAARTEHAESAWPGVAGSPIARLAGLARYRAEHPLFEMIVSLIDGQRTAADIARVLIDTNGLPRDAALPAVEACLRAIARKLGGPGEVS